MVRQLDGPQAWPRDVARTFCLWCSELRRGQEYMAGSQLGEQGG